MMKEIIKLALFEDIGSGDLTASLIPAVQQDCAYIISRQEAILCGTTYVDEIYREIDPQIKISWQTHDGDKITAQQILCDIEGPTRSIVSGERCALNFLQILSSTATLTNKFVTQIKGTNTKLLDTRKTIPGLRAAQKYAVLCGGGENHRQGLFDAILIKENHIAACGSITNAVTQAKKNHPHKKIEVEVTNLVELQEALTLTLDQIMLDNFKVEDIKKAVNINSNNVNRAKLEASGNINVKNIRAVAKTGVDYISVGAITKNIVAIDFSMLMRPHKLKHTK